MTAASEKAPSLKLHSEEHSACRTCAPLGEAVAL
jgi:hypothetical protein